MRNLILSLLMISVSTLSAQTYKLDFSNWDKNRDGRIDKYEFVSVFKRQYASDKNFTQDKGLDDEDFYQYIFKRADLDQNGDLRGGEWQFEYDYYYDNAYLPSNYEMYDQNGDKIVTYSEYYQGVTRDNYFSLWDMNKDQFISETELAETVFKNWDSNNDSSMSRSEYTYFDSFFSDI